MRSGSIGGFRPGDDKLRDRHGIPQVRFELRLRENEEKLLADAAIHEMGDGALA